MTDLNQGYIVAKGVPLQAAWREKCKRMGIASIIVIPTQEEFADIEFSISYPGELTEEELTQLRGMFPDYSPGFFTASEMGFCLEHLPIEDAIEIAKRWVDQIRDYISPEN